MKKLLIIERRYGFKRGTAADEPTGNLDSKTTVEVIGLLKASCRKYSQTILMVTHNEAIAQTCDRIIHIEDGMISTGIRRISHKGGDDRC